MATTTPNFGWPVPTSTDLVKDGATAIEGLGDAIDASLLDLKGGTSGQVLAKNSNTDMDFVWVAQDDSNAIQNAIVDAKGDLIAATAADTPSRLAVGTNGQVLTADSTTATGLKWAAAAAGATLVGCQLTKSANQSLSNATETAITFNGETWDTDSFHDNATNNTRITIPSGKAGKYDFSARIAIEGMNGNVYVLIKLNGAVWEYPVVINATGSTSFNTNFTMSFLMDLAVADYVELFIYQGSGSSKNCLTGTTFGVNYLGA
jgi:hypothetical protein